MDLNEIESATDALLERLASTESAAEVRDLCFRLDGMYRGAQVKAIVFGVDRQASSEEFRARELAAMERAAQAASMAVAANIPKPTCIAVDRLGVAKCALPAGHTGRHEDGGFAPLSWPNDDPYPEPTKPAVDRLHELVSFIREGQAGAPFASAEEVLDIADKLEEILREGTL